MTEDLLDVMRPHRDEQGAVARERSAQELVAAEAQMVDALELAEATLAGDVGCRDAGRVVTAGRRADRGDAGYLVDGTEDERVLAEPPSKASLPSRRPDCHVIAGMPSWTFAVRLRWSFSCRRR